MFIIEGCKCDSVCTYLVRANNGSIVFASQDVTKVTDFIKDSFNKEVKNG